MTSLVTSAPLLTKISHWLSLKPKGKKQVDFGFEKWRSGERNQMFFPTCQVRVVRFYVSYSFSSASCQLPMAVFPPGPQLSESMSHTMSESMSDRMSESMSDRMPKFMSDCQNLCQIGCHNFVHQIECQNISQIEGQNLFQIESESMSDRIEFMSDRLLFWLTEWQNICQIGVLFA